MAQEREYDCESLIEEYEALRLKTEGIRMIDHEPTEDELDAMGISQEDLERLQEVNDLIGKHCEMYVSAEDKIDIARDPGLMGSSVQNPKGPED